MTISSTVRRRTRKLTYSPLIFLETLRYANRIYQTCPIVTHPQSAGGDVELHVMTYSRDWKLALWALKSFYAFSRVEWPLVLHIGGPDTDIMIASLCEHFPNAVILSMRASDDLVEEELTRRGLHRLLRARRRSLPIRKITDFLISARSQRVASFDPDVLFFRSPNEFVSEGETGHSLRYMLDVRSAYCLTPDEVLQSYRVRLIPRINTGLYVVPVGRFSLEKCDELVADERFFRFWMAEQTVQAIVASEEGGGLFPDTYCVSGGLGLQTASGQPIVAKHYTETPRPDFFREGLKHLVKDTDLLSRLTKG